VTRRVLVIDDEPALRRTLQRALTGLGYEVSAVADPNSAYQILAESDFDVVLLDLRLPQMPGDTLFLAIVRHWPRLLGRVILMSGDLHTPQPDWPAELLHCPVLHKPFSLDALATIVGDVLAAAEPNRDLLEGNGNS
jgi:two-component system, cell cycle sensor histidine kinase and response regulator CckA